MNDGFGPVRRLVCVAASPAIDKLVAVDRLAAGEIHRPELLTMLAGGKALNAARAAATLGVPVSVVAVLAGHAGAWVSDELGRTGIGVRRVDGAGETRTCLSVLDRGTGSLTEFYEDAPRLEPATLAALEAAVAEALAADPGGTIVALSGSLPAGASLDTYARLGSLVARSGGRAVIDAGGGPLARALAGRPWLVRCNAAEAAAATGLPAEATAATGLPGEVAPRADATGAGAAGAGAAGAGGTGGTGGGAAGGSDAGVVASARALVGAGARMALVSRGAAGAVLVDPDGVAWRIGAAPRGGAFSVGSGDSMLAGFVAGIARGDSPAEAARWGAAAGAANTLRPGQGRLDLVDVAGFASRIALERLPG